MTIDLEEFLKLPNPNIIDIRENYLYQMKHIPNSINIPYSYLVINPNKYLNKSDTYYLYCQAGYSSKSLAKRLNNLGFNTYSLNGGYNKYRLKNN